MYAFPTIQYTQWKPATKETLIGLIAEGKLGLEQISAIIFSGRVGKISLRRAIWKAIKSRETTEEQINLVKTFFPVLYGD